MKKHFLHTAIVAMFAAGFVACTDDAPEEIFQEVETSGTTDSSLGVVINPNKVNGSQPVVESEDANEEHTIR
jgi:hypothetical protein